MITQYESTIKIEPRHTNAFQVLDHFMVRSPLLPMHFFNQKLSVESLESMDLYEKILYFKGLINENKEIEEVF